MDKLNFRKSKEIFYSTTFTLKKKRDFKRVYSCLRRGEVLIEEELER